MLHGLLYLAWKCALSFLAHVSYFVLRHGPISVRHVAGFHMGCTCPPSPCMAMRPIHNFGHKFLSPTTIGIFTHTYWSNQTILLYNPTAKPLDGHFFPSTRTTSCNWDYGNKKLLDHKLIGARGLAKSKLCPMTPFLISFGPRRFILCIVKVKSLWVCWRSYMPINLCLTLCWVDW